MYSPYILYKWMSTFFHHPNKMFSARYKVRWRQKTCFLPLLLLLVLWLSLPSFTFLSRSHWIPFVSFFFHHQSFISIVVRLKLMSNSFLCVHVRNLPNSRFSILTEIIVPKTIQHKYFLMYIVAVLFCDFFRLAFACPSFTSSSSLIIPFKSLQYNTVEPFFHPFHFSMQISVQAPFSPSPAANTPKEHARRKEESTYTFRSDWNWNKCS